MEYSSNGLRLAYLDYRPPGTRFDNSTSIGVCRTEKCGSHEMKSYGEDLKRLRDRNSITIIGSVSYQEKGGIP